jgi:hypothetical protein
VHDVVARQMQLVGGMSEVASGGSLGSRIRRLVAGPLPVAGDKLGPRRTDLGPACGRPPLRRPEHTLGRWSKFLAERRYPGRHRSE